MSTMENEISYPEAAINELIYEFAPLAQRIADKHNIKTFTECSAFAVTFHISMIMTDIELCCKNKEEFECKKAAVIEVMQRREFEDRH